jgi:hypothetical protein
MAEGYLIGPGLRDAIKETITRVGEMPYRVTRNEPPSRFEDIPSPGQKLKRGTYTGSWAIGTTAEVTLAGSTQTYAVTNYCIEAEGDTASSASFNVVFGSVMGTQTAVEIQVPTQTCTMVVGGFDLTELPNYDAGQIQLLGHGAADTNYTACQGLQWYSVISCSTSTVSIT